MLGRRGRLAALIEGSNPEPLPGLQHAERNLKKWLNERLSGVVLL